MFSAAESIQSSRATRSSAAAVCITAIASSKYEMKAACEGQSAGATIRSGRARSKPSVVASSSAVDGRTAPSRWQWSSALRQLW